MQIKESIQQFMLIKTKNAIKLLDYHKNDNFDNVNNKLMEMFGSVNYFHINLLYQSNLEKYIEVRQIVDGVLKNEYLKDSSLLQLFLKYPEFYLVLKKSLYKENPILFDNIEKISFDNPKKIDLAYFAQFYSIVDLIHLNIYDPTKNKKYFKWICKIFRFDIDRIYEDGEKVSELLTKFDNINIKNLMKKKGMSIDIMDYKNERDLFKKIDEIEDSEEMNISNNKRYEKCLIGEFGNFKLYEICSHEDSVILGKNTFWCTAGESLNGKNNFNHYTNNGYYPLYIVMDNNGNKYQYSFFTGDFLNKNDDKFNFYLLPKELWDYLYELTLSMMGNKKPITNYNNSVIKFYEKNSFYL